MIDPVTPARPTTAWPVVIAFATVVASTQLLWLTFAPIDTDVARDLSVSVTSVGWLANVFPLAYLLLALPAGLALDRWFRPTLLLGAGLTVLGAAIRFAAPSFSGALAGQTLAALAQPLVLNAITKVATGYLPETQRAAGIALGSAAQLIGPIAAFVLGPALESHHGVTTLLGVDLVIAAAAFMTLAVGLRRPPAVTGPAAGAGRAELRAVWSVPSMRPLAALAFIGSGVFGALSTYLQPILAHDHISSTDAGLVLAGMLVAGIAGCAVAPPIIARRRAERAYLTSTVVWVAAGMALLAVLHASLLADFVIAAAIGALLLAALPIILGLTERRMGASGGVATGMLLMAGNGGVVIVAVAVGLCTGVPVIAFALLAAVTLVALPAPRHIGVTE